ncbi:SAV_915 family protein [Streptomyces sp. NPDC000594]|uniref:SAV_915 family protein n=1 Tax=Streptomyces sp. NPDC000594 TaxID=3154261 RepID=UPI00331E2183
MDTLTREAPATGSGTDTDLGAETADPDEPRPAGPLYVPVRLGSAGGRQLCFVRTPLGVRTAVGFTSEERLRAVLGRRQRWIRLAEPALRSLAEPLGVTTVTVDPQLGAPAPESVPHRSPVLPCARRTPLAPEAARRAPGTPAGLSRTPAGPVPVLHPFPSPN